MLGVFIPSLFGQRRKIFIIFQYSNKQQCWGIEVFFVNGDIFRDCNDIKTKMFNQAEPMASPYNTTIVFTKTRNKESGCRVSGYGGN